MGFRDQLSSIQLEDTQRAVQVFLDTRSDPDRLKEDFVNFPSLMSIGTKVECAVIDKHVLHEKEIPFDDIKLLSHGVAVGVQVVKLCAELSSSELKKSLAALENYQIDEAIQSVLETSEHDMLPGYKNPQDFPGLASVGLQMFRALRERQQDKDGAVHYSTGATLGVEILRKCAEVDDLRKSCLGFNDFDL